MILHNQSKHHLRWKISMREYTCEPYGSVDIPDMFVKHCKKRGLALDVSPVPSEVRANATLRDATEAARSDELVLLRNEVELAKASEKEAKRSLELEMLARSKDADRQLKTETSLAEAKRVLTEKSGELKASEELLAETAKELEIAKNTIKRLEAVEEQRAAAKKQDKPASASK
jgi:hypothetical protein